MDFSFTQRQRLIRSAVRDLLEKECGADLIREMENDEKGYSPELWHKLAELGWLGLFFPNKYGGSGASFFDLIVFLEEIGRYLVPVPFLSTVILGGMSILYGGSEEQKQTLLPKIANGELILTMALTEPDPIYSVSGIKIGATREGNSYLINGIKVFIPSAHIADYLVVPTLTQGKEKDNDGITLFLIETKRSDVSCNVLNTTASSKLCEVVFNRTKVASESILGQFNEGWVVLRKVLELATVAQCALMVGGAEKVLEMTVDYAKKRIQFNRPIGSFQAIQHRCSNMLVDLDGAKFVTYEAAWKLGQGLPNTLEVSIAKAWVNQAYQRICANGHQVHGGIGVIKDHDMYLYSMRAKEAEFFLGDTTFHRGVIAERLGL
jgi:alkylation response protein AidB-like acyl-CoA dehydrogenase